MCSIQTLCKNVHFGGLFFLSLNICPNNIYAPLIIYPPCPLVLDINGPNNIFPQHIIWVVYSVRTHWWNSRWPRRAAPAVTATMPPVVAPRPAAAPCLAAATSRSVPLCVPPWPCSWSSPPCMRTGRNASAKCHTPPPQPAAAGLMYGRGHGFTMPCICWGHWTPEYLNVVHIFFLSCLIILTSFFIVLLILCVLILYV